MRFLTEDQQVPVLKICYSEAPNLASNGKI